jgi:NADH-ubiquinone oxidoreductase chain 6
MNNIYLIKDFVSNGLKVEFLDIIYLVSIFFGIFTIISVNPIVSVLFLIGLFVNISVLLILIGYNFIGLSYILVYVGAVSILFLFILMLINIRISEIISENNNYIPLAILTVILFYYIIGQVLPLNLIDQSFLTYLPSSILEDNIEISNNEYFKFIEQIVYTSSKGWDNSLVDITQISSIGNIMYTSYAIFLIIVSIILLLAMVGAIIITIKQKQ